KAGSRERPPRDDRVGTSRGARRAGAYARHCAERIAHSHRLQRPGQSGTGGAPAGTLRRHGDAAHRPRAGAAHIAPALARPPSDAGDAGSGELLARDVLRRAEGPARPLSETLLAGKPTRGRADEPREAAEGVAYRSRIRSVGSTG